MFLVGYWLKPDNAFAAMFEPLVAAHRRAEPVSGTLKVRGQPAAFDAGVDVGGQPAVINKNLTFCWAAAKIYLAKRMVF